MINDLMFVFVPVPGEFYDITGIVDYSYSNFKIEPRDENDVIVSSSSIYETILHTQIELFNYPNPFNPETIIYFKLNTDNTENTEILIFNIKGQKVKQLLSKSAGQLSAGKHSVIWNGTDENNKVVSAGIYFYQLKVGNKFFEIKKMLLLK